MGKRKAVNRKGVRRRTRRRLGGATRKRYTGALARRPRTYRFSRETWCDINLSDFANPATLPLIEHQYLDSATVPNTQLNINFMVNLASIPENTEFINLFQKYRIKAFSVQLIPQVNTTYPGSGNPNLVCHMMQNNSCELIGTLAAPGPLRNLNQTALAQIPRKRQFMFGARNRPRQFYIKTKQSTQVAAPAAGAGTDYVVTAPKFISTSETTAYHGGMLLAIQTADNSNIKVNPDGAYKYKMRIRTYIECRYVK